MSFSAPVLRTPSQNVTAEPGVLITETSKTFWEGGLRTGDEIMPLLLFTAAAYLPLQN